MIRPMRVFALLFASIVLSACSDWPDIGPARVSQDAPWPRLLPLDAFLDAPEQRIEDGDAERLAARAAALRSRAAVLRRPAGDDAAFEAIRARMAAF